MYEAITKRIHLIQIGQRVAGQPPEHHGEGHAAEHKALAVLKLRTVRFSDRKMLVMKRDSGVHMARLKLDIARFS